MAESRFFITSKHSLPRKLSRASKQKHVLTQLANVNVREAYRDLYESVLKNLERERYALSVMLNDKRAYSFMTSVFFPLPRNKRLQKHLFYIKRLQECVDALNRFLYEDYGKYGSAARKKLIDHCDAIVCCADSAIQHRSALSEKDGFKVVFGGVVLAIAVLLFVATLPVSGVISGFFFGVGVLLALNSLVLLAGFARECVRNSLLPSKAAEKALQIDRIGLPGLRYHAGQEQFELDVELSEGAKDSGLRL